MREILTIVASVVVAVLAALSIAPPLINWEEHRPLLDQAISRAAGVEMRSYGRIALRILPEPRLRFDQVVMIQDQHEAPLLRADGVKADLALMPLFRGEFRFNDTTVNRAEMVIVVAREGQLPFFDQAVSGLGRRKWTFDNLQVGQLVLTTQVAGTGRTDQVVAENVRVQSGTIGGAWRLEGTTSGIPFQLSTGEMDPDGHIRARLRGGAEEGVQFDIDGGFAVAGNGTADGMQEASGHARFSLNLRPSKPDSATLPIVLQADFRSGGQGITLGGVSVQGGEEGSGPRLEGTGRLDPARMHLGLNLVSTRIDGDAFLNSIGGWAGLAGQFNDLRGRMSLPMVAAIDLDLSVDSVGLLAEELAGLSLRVGFDRKQAHVEHFGFIAPGESRFVFRGDVNLDRPHDVYGQISLTSAASDRLGRFLEKAGIGLSALKLFDSRNMEASSDIAFAAPVLSLYNLRAGFGEASISGNLRYTADAQGRDRMDIQMIAKGVDLANWPAAVSPAAMLEGVDWSVQLEAYDIRYGRQAGAGQIGARLHSLDSRLVVETLDVRNLAGADIHVAGETGIGGSHMAGRVSAAKAAPLLDLLSHFGNSNLVGLVPDKLRLDAVDLAWNTRHVEGDFPGWRTELNGRAAGGPVEAGIFSDDSGLRDISVNLRNDKTSLGEGMPALPLVFALRGAKDGTGTLAASIDGEIAGLRFSTPEPLRLKGEGRCFGEGPVDFASEDLTHILPFTVPDVALKARAVFSCVGNEPSISVSGDFGQSRIEGDLRSKALNDWSGNIRLGSLSLPRLLNALILHPEGAGGTDLWPSARFADHKSLDGRGQFGLRVGQLDLGNGFISHDAALSLGISPDGVVIDGTAGGLLDGKLGGKLSFSRQGGLATVTGEIRIEDVAFGGSEPSGKLAGRLSGKVSFGSSGQSVAGMISNLGGAGELKLDDLTIADTDPNALQRLSSQLLEDNDPLRDGFIPASLRRELGQAQLRAGTISTPVSIVGGTLRFSQLVLDGGTSSWRGLATFDLKTLQFGARGTLQSRSGPEGWQGGLPQAGLSWTGPLASLTRTIDPAPLTNGIAAIILKRETDRIQRMEEEARQRKSRVEQQGQASPGTVLQQP